MPLTLQEQLDVATTSLVSGDFDLMAKMFLDPDTVSFAEQRSTAEKLGMKRGFLSAAVNIVSDPTVWIALLLSRHFPTSSFLKGTIPHRFIGAANEFTGLSCPCAVIHTVPADIEIPFYQPDIT